MEQSKFENGIKEKMQSREIMPSENAWDRLDAMLTVAEKKAVPKKRKIGWLSIAAVVVFVLSLGYVIQLNVAMEHGSLEVVDVNKKSISKDEVDVINGNDTEIKQAQPKTSNSNEVLQLANNSSAVSNNKPNRIVEEIVKSEVVEVSKDKSASDLSVVVSENESKKSKLAVVPTVEEQIVVVEKQKIKVDARALLNQVDGEMELTFREKVFKSIKKNFKDAKEAVVSRNEESSINH